MAKKRKPARKRAEGFVLDASVALAWCFSDEADPYADAVARKCQCLTTPRLGF
jgi:hypothetical protein